MTRLRCRWSQLVAFIASGLYLVYYATTACILCDHTVHSILCDLTKSRGSTLVLLISVFWTLGCTAYVAILWDSLGDSPAEVTAAGYSDCESFFEDTQSEYDEFLTLWKLTACMYFISCIITFCICSCAACILPRANHRKYQQSQIKVLRAYGMFATPWHRVPRLLMTWKEKSERKCCC